MALTDRAKKSLESRRELLLRKKALLEERAALDAPEEEPEARPGRKELQKSTEEFQANIMNPGKAEAFSGKALQDASLGLLNVVPGFKSRVGKLAEKEPDAALAGGLVGALHPASLGSKVYGAISSLSGLGRAAPGVIRGAAEGAFGTGLSAGAEQGIRELTADEEGSGKRVLEAAGKGLVLGGATGGLLGALTKAAGPARRAVYNNAFPEEKAIGPEAAKFEARKAAGQVKDTARGPSRTEDASLAAPFGTRHGTMTRSFRKIKALDDELQGTLDEVGRIGGDYVNNWNVPRDVLFDEFSQNAADKINAVRLKAGPEAVKSYLDTVNTALGDIQDFSIKDLQKIKRDGAWGNLDDRAFQGSDVSARKLALKDLGYFLKDKIENVATDFSKSVNRPDLGQKIRKLNREQGSLLEHVDRVASSAEPSLRRSVVRGAIGGSVLGGAAAPAMGYEAYKVGVPAGAAIGGLDYLLQTAPVATALTKGFKASEEFGKDPAAILRALAALSGEKK